MGKDTAIYLRIEEEKKLALEKKAQDAGLSLSTYLVEQGLHGKVADFSHLRQIYPQLMRIGININQATRIMNTYHSSTGDEFDFIYDEFLKLRTLLEEYLRRAGRGESVGVCEGAAGIDGGSSEEPD